MKKRVNFLLILSIVCLTLTTVLCFFSVIFEDFNFPATSIVMDNVNNASENDPGVGWYFLLAGSTALTIDILSGFAIIILLVFLPISISLLVVILQTLARLFQIGNNKKWKDITGQILSIISIIIQILLCNVLVFNLLSNFSVSKILLFLALFINITSIVLFIRQLLLSYKK